MLKVRCRALTSFNRRIAAIKKKITMTPPPVTSRFAAFVAETDYSSISRKAIENAKLHILDTLGVALAGYEHPVANIVLDYCKSMGGTPDVTIVGSSQKTSVPMGAFANGLLAHAIDYDDWDAVARVGHPSCMIVASSLSIGEANGASGKDFLRGIRSRD